MPRFVVKATPDRDLYVYWSSIVNCPVFIGTRAELIEHLTRTTMAHPEKRVALADETGTSALYCDPLREGAWADTGFMYMHRGWLPRARLAELLDRWMAERDTGAEPDVGDLLDPFED